MQPGPNPAAHAMTCSMGALMMLLLCWSLLRGRRWARSVGMFYAGLIIVLGPPMVIALLLLDPAGGTALGWQRSHRVEAALGACSVALLLTAFLYLRKKEAREYFLQR